MEWWENFFDEDMEKILFLPERWERAEATCDSLVNLLGISPPQKVLDLACGVGRYSIALARRGFEVTGLDYSELYIRKATEKSRALALRVNYIQGDMREIPFEDEFSAVICVFTSFGYFEKEEDHLKVLREVRKSLKKEGKFLLELINTEWLIRNFKAKDWSEDEDGYFLDKREFDPVNYRVNCEWLWIKRGKIKRYFHSLRLFTLSELIRLLGDSGLKVIGYYSSLERDTWSMDSPRTLIITEKE